MLLGTQRLLERVATAQTRLGTPRIRQKGNAFTLGERRGVIWWVAMMMTAQSTESGESREDICLYVGHRNVIHFRRRSYKKTG